MEFDLELASCTDIGKIREKNEDSVLIAPELSLAAVADGMGGHNAGEVASNLAVNVIRQVLGDIEAHKTIIPKDFDPSLPQAARALAYSAYLANERIFELAAASPKRRGMGTTLSAVYFDGSLGTATAAHIGDSRIYLLRGGELKQISTDHSYVMDQVAKGAMSKEEAEKSRVQNILTKAMGLRKDVRSDSFPLLPHPGDVYMLCSDGVNKGLSDAQIKEILAKEGSAGKKCHEIVKTAARNDGKDNVSCVVIKVFPKKPKKRFLGLFKA